MKKKHLYRNEIYRHKSISAFCGAVIDKDDVDSYSTDLESVTCGNCLKPGCIALYELEQKLKRAKRFNRSLDNFRTSSNDWE